MSAQTEGLAVAPPAPAPALRQNRRFQLILAGSFISTLGDGFHSVALGIWVLQTTGSATAMSAIVTVRVIIGILLGAVGGTVADRADRWRLMWRMDLLRGAVVFGIALLMIRGHAPFGAILALTALGAVVGQFRSPAFSASIMQIVGREQLAQARGIMQMTGTVAQVIGPFLGGAIVAALGGWVAMSGDALSFVVSGLAVLVAGSFASPQHNRQDRSSFWTDLMQGWVYIKQNPFIMAITLIAPTLNFFANAFGVLVPVIAVKVWKAPAVEFGALEAMLPLGVGIGGALLIALGNRLRRRGWWMSGGLLACGPFIALIALAPSARWALPLMAAMGLQLAFTNILLTTTLQTETSSELQGRVFGTMSSLNNIATPLSVAAAGPLADLYGPSAIAAGAGVLITLLALVAVLRFRVLRTFD